MAVTVERALLRALVAFAAVSPMLACCLSAAADPPDTRPIVVLRQDDCRITWRTPFPELDGLNALEYGKSKQIPITWAIVSAAQGGLTWAELQDYLDTAGGEPASHSVHHTEMPTTDDYVAELVDLSLIHI